MCDNISEPKVENTFAPTLVGAAYAAGERERGMPGRADFDPLDVPGKEFYRCCPMRAAGKCGKFPETGWSEEDKGIWISGCGRREYCAAAVRAYARGRI